MLDDLGLAVIKPSRKFYQSYFESGLASTQMAGLNSRSLFLESLPAMWWLRGEADKVAEHDRWQLGRSSFQSHRKSTGSLSSADVKPGLEDAAITQAVGNSPASQINCLEFAFPNVSSVIFLLHQWTVGFPETRMEAVVSSLLPRKIFGCIYGFLRAS